jgi:hypothetical protein
MSAHHQKAAITKSRSHFCFVSQAVILSREIKNGNETFSFIKV